MHYNNNFRWLQNRDPEISYILTKVYAHVFCLKKKKNYIQIDPVTLTSKITKTRSQYMLT